MTCHYPNIRKGPEAPRSWRRRTPSPSIQLMGSRSSSGGQNENQSPPSSYCSAAVTFVASAPAIVRAQEKPTKIRIGLVRLISSGPIFIAEARKFFEKVNLDAELTYFADGALAMPALVAGELDLTAKTLNAGLFHTVSKGAPFKLILDRGSEKPGHGSMTIVASNDMYEQGYRSAKDGAKLKGKTIAIQAPGSIDQYLLGRAAEKAGLNPK